MWGRYAQIVSQFLTKIFGMILVMLPYRIEFITWRRDVSTVSGAEGRDSKKNKNIRAVGLHAVAF